MPACAVRDCRVAAARMEGGPTVLPRSVRGLCTVTLSFKRQRESPSFAPAPPQDLLPSPRDPLGPQVRGHPAAAPGQAQHPRQLLVVPLNVCGGHANVQWAIARPNVLGIRLNLHLVQALTLIHMNPLQDYHLHIHLPVLNHHHRRRATLLSQQD